MALGDFLAKLGGGTPQAPPEPTVPAAPGRDDLAVALAQVESMVGAGAVPSCVTARVERVTHVVRDTVPRLGQIRGSASAYSVVATATDYLPEALGGYLRLPRRFADTRPVDGGRTSLMVLVDQLDLLGATMDQVFDAVCRDDATALVAHGRFLEEKFGHASSGGELDVGGTMAVPPMPVFEPVSSALPDAPEESTVVGEGDIVDADGASADANDGDLAVPDDAPDVSGTAMTPDAPAVEPPEGAPRRSVLDLDGPTPPGAGSPTAPQEPSRLTPPTWL